MKIEPGQVAVVTGGASGIGFALAGRLAVRGVDLVLVDVEATALQKAAPELEGRGIDVLSVECDVRDHEQVDGVARRALEHFGHVDIVANNAGIFSGLGAMWELDLTDWRWNIEVNLWGVINGIRAFTPHLVERGTGHVINTASLAGLADVPFNGPYNAAKHGVVALSETLRNELDQRAPAVGVTVVCPGMVATNIQHAARNRPVELTRSRSDRPAPVFLDSDEGTEAAREMGSVTSEGGGTGPADPYDYAGKILEAVEANRLHCVVDEATRLAAHARIDRLLADLD